MAFWKTDDFLPHYDDWKTSEKIEREVREERDPDEARDAAIDRKQMESEERSSLAARGPWPRPKPI
ncbi:MAG: hypothetical protein ACRD8A_08810 [Candidatus Acidiferrales bacterium]